MFENLLPIWKFWVIVSVILAFICFCIYSVNGGLRSKNKRIKISAYCGYFIISIFIFAFSFLQYKIVEDNYKEWCQTQDTKYPVEIGYDIYQLSNEIENKQNDINRTKEAIERYQFTLKEQEQSLIKINDQLKELKNKGVSYED